MKNISRRPPVVLAIAFGLLTLLGLLVIPALGDLLMGWASFLAAVALLLGVLNLLSVHLLRLRKGNVYSSVLVLSLLAVFFLALTDYAGITEDGVETVFEQVQAPLEAAMASLLAFFLLFAGFRMLQRQRSWLAVLFIATVILIMLGNTLLPPAISNIFGSLSDFISSVLVNPGVRGILIGVALGTVTVSLRLLVGWERPYDR